MLIIQGGAAFTTFFEGSASSSFSVRSGSTTGATVSWTCIGPSAAAGIVAAVAFVAVGAATGAVEAVVGVAGRAGGVGEPIGWGRSGTGVFGEAGAGVACEDVAMGWGRLPAGTGRKGVGRKAAGEVAPDAVAAPAVGTGRWGFAGP